MEKSGKRKSEKAESFNTMEIQTDELIPTPNQRNVAGGKRAVRGANWRGINSAF
jgi:hypothetical protein